MSDRPAPLAPPTPRLPMYTPDLIGIRSGDWSGLTICRRCFLPVRIDHDCSAVEMEPDNRQS